MLLSNILGGTPDLLLALSAGTANRDTLEAFASPQYGVSEGASPEKVLAAGLPASSTSTRMWMKRGTTILSEVNATDGSIIEQMDITSVTATDIVTDERDGTTTDRYGIFALRFATGFEASIIDLDIDSTVATQAYSSMGVDPTLIMGVVGRGTIGDGLLATGIESSGYMWFIGDAETERCHSVSVDLDTGTPRTAKSLTSDQLFKFRNADATDELVGTLDSLVIVTGKHL